MKKRLFLITLALALSGCNTSEGFTSTSLSRESTISSDISSNDITSSFQSSSTSSKSNYIDDDESEKMIMQIHNYSYENCEALSLFIQYDYKEKNNYAFLLLAFPNNNAPYIPGHRISFCFDECENDVYTNPSIRESFYIYDEELGTLTNPDLDTGIFYSMVFNCVFYPFDGYETNKNYKVEPISETKIKVTIENDTDVLGYIYVSLTSLDHIDYVLDYLYTNLSLY